MPGAALVSGSELKVVRQNLADIEEAEGLTRVEGWGFEYVQLSGGRLTGQHARLALPAMLLTFVDYGETSLTITGMRPEGVMPIILPLWTGTSFRTGGKPVTCKDAVLHWATPEVDVAIEGGFRCHSIQLGSKTYEQILRACPWWADGKRNGGGPELSLSRPVVERLKQTLSPVLGSNGEELSVLLTPLTASFLSAYIVSSLLDGLNGRDEALPMGRNNQPGKRPLYLERARDLMMTRRHEPLSLADLCAETGVNARTLTNAFVKRFGESPVKLHSLMRLEGARRDLKHASPHETTVTEVATEWGFWHLGRFSQAYRSQFGESPSQTLTSRASKVAFSARDLQTIVAEKPPPVSSPSRAA